jgi:crotonobetainyl-CoA:carnitine CoA-transferase CaiB-like acyl-CoA transferase
VPDAGAPPADHHQELRRALQAAGFRKLVDHPAVGEPSEPCPVLAWAASGAMALTGFPGRPPRWPAGAIIGRLGAALSLLDQRAAAGLTAGAVLTGRAAHRGLARQGTVSAGGRCRLLPASDGWVAISLARPADAASVPALVGGRLPEPRGADPWGPLAAHVARQRAAATAEQAQLLGVPAAVLPPDPPDPPDTPWAVTRPGREGQPGWPGPDGWRSGISVADPGVPGRTRPLVVVDLSALWAGPLCAWLLGLAGATVLKVEDRRRPDAARWGDPWLFAELHAGHRSVTLDLGSLEGRAALRAVVESADVVVEASRPRALAELDLLPDAFLANRPGRTWVSITGYGRQGDGAGRVAFGDDAAVAGGLVACHPGEPPVFCADAVADPLAGTYAAVAVLASQADGGGHLIDCAMATAAAFANRPSPCPGHHRVGRAGGEWVVDHDGQRMRIARPAAGPLAPGHPRAPVAAFGADTSQVLARLALEDRQPQDR